MRPLQRSLDTLFFRRNIWQRSSTHTLSAARELFGLRKDEAFAGRVAFYEPAADEYSAPL